MFSLKLGYNLAMRLAAMVVLLVAGGASAQPNPPTRETFKAALMTFQKQLPTIRKSLQDIKIDELLIKYAEGKIIEQNVAIADENIELASKQALQILRIDRLSDEIGLLVTTLETAASLQKIEGLLLAPNFNDKKTADKASTWAQSLQNLDEQSVETFYKVIFLYTTSRAAEIEGKGN